MGLTHDAAFLVLFCAIYWVLFGLLAWGRARDWRGAFIGVPLVVLGGFLAGALTLLVLDIIRAQMSG